MKHIASLLFAGMLGTLPLLGDDGIEVSHLSSTNTLVRIVDATHPYLLLPVEEGVDDTPVSLLLDGKPATTFHVRLARSKVDYYVPFDLARYAGHKVLLSVTTKQGRESVRDVEGDLCWHSLRLSDSFDTTNREKYRPAYHHTPRYGWMNDPNGMFYKDGLWHLYYQYNPYGSKWQNMSWAHSSSPDLLHWEHHPVAIEPNGLGTVYSGSCVVDTAGSAGFGRDAVIALYTSASDVQMQSMGVSTDDGQTFALYPGNPILTLETEARDPNMFWNDSLGLWNMLLAHPLEHEMLIFSSPNLREWTLESRFGKGLGAQGGVWECPDLLQLPVEGSDEKRWVLICNLNPGGIFGGSATQYFTGLFDGKCFTPDRNAAGEVPTKWMDYGKDHYATVSWSNAPDGRHVVIGWMSNWQYGGEVPTRQFRSANTLPRDLSLFRGEDGGYYLKTIPSPEVNALRGRRSLAAGSKTISAKPQVFQLPTANDGICEISLTALAAKSSRLTLTLSNRKGEQVVMCYNPAEQTFSVDRTASGITDFSADFPAIVVAPTLSSDPTLSLRLFIDRSSLEVFDAEGRFVLTNLLFPTEPYTTLTLTSEGGKSTLRSLEVYPINPTIEN